MSVTYRALASKERISSKLSMMLLKSLFGILWRRHGMEAGGTDGGLVLLVCSCVCV